MALQDQVIPVAFGQGIDTKTDSKAVSAKLLQLQDAVFTQAHQVNKRNGYTQLSSSIIGGGTLSDPQMAASLNNQLILADSDSLYNYSSTLQGWSNRGSYIPCKVTTQTISADLNSQVYPTAALSGNYLISTWTETTLVANVTSITDISSNSEVMPPITLAPGASNIYFARALSLGTSPSNIPAIVGTISSATGLFLYTFSVALSGITVNGPFTITASAITGRQAFDVANTSTGGVITYQDNATHNIVVNTVNTSGSIVNTYTLTGIAATATNLSLCVGTNGNIWVYYVDSTYNIRYFILSPTLSVVLVDTLLVSTSGTTVPHLGATPVSATVQTLIYSQSSSIYSDIHSVSPTSGGGAVSPSTVVTNMDLSSKPFIYNGKTYFWANYTSSVTVSGIPTQGGQFLYCVDIGGAVGKVFYGATNGASMPSNTPMAPIVISAGVYAMAFPQLLTGDTLVSVITPENQTSLVKTDFTSTDLFQYIEANNTLLLNGGIVWEYDGNTTYEYGFNLSPEIQSLTPSSTGGSLSAGDYQYAAIYKWVDAQGNMHQSNPYLLTVTTTGSGTASVAVVVKTPTISMKGFPQLAVYRTEVNADNFTLVHVATVTKGTSSISFTDTYSDTQIAPDDALYTNGGVIENIAPPPAIAFGFYNNRVWLIDSTNPNSVWYSKTLAPNTGVSFSDLFAIQVNAAGGNCIAVAGMDSNLVIFEDNLPLVIQGDGANDAGTGSTLTNPVPIPSDAGCSTSKGLIVFPQGILRKTPKGIYRLDRSLTDKYWGYPVEKYNSQDITATTLLKDKTQIRFLTSSGLTLVYDYFFDQWSTFTNHQGHGATIWNGNYTYVRTDGTVFTETSGYYLDGASTQISPLINTGWLAIGSIQGFERVRQLLMLGNFAGSASGHGIQISYAYDYGSTYITTNPFYLSNSLNSPVYQLRNFLPQQKCEAVSIKIQELTTGSSSEYITFTELSFIAALKKGLNRLPAAVSTG